MSDSFIPEWRNLSYFANIFFSSVKALFHFVVDLCKVTPILSLSLIVFATIILFLLMERLIVKEKIKSVSRNATEISTQEFFSLRSAKYGGRKLISNSIDFPGIYILHNVSKQKNYVGQSKKVIQRVNSHLTGHANGDVYFDYRNGDVFTVKMIALKGSGFSSLNQFERIAIREYHALYPRGYNKTRGNKDHVFH